MMPPETRYAKSGAIDIAYQVVGSGPLDLVYVPGFVSNLDVTWENPEIAAFYSRLATFSRLILFDKRGTGLSDRMSGIATLEERMDDVRAVMDAAGSERAALYGVSEGGPMSLLFAATYPERTRALVLYASFARHPTLTPERLEADIARINREWGTGAFIANTFQPDLVPDEAMLRVFARRERQSASPSAAITVLRMNSEIDARHVLPAIRAPTLILHRIGDERVTIDAGRFLAAHIPGARMVELPGVNHNPFSERNVVERIADEIEEFLTGSRGHEPEIDRVLATVMFTDIVDSTKRAAELGDRQWRALVERHDGVVRDQLARFRGREVEEPRRWVSRHV